jgi:hypothetical protein
MRETITVDDRGVRRILADGQTEEVRWADLTEVSVVTTDEGPFAEDVFFVLVGVDGTGCLVPQGAPESAALLERIQELPGFNNEVFIQAMASSQNARFLCWRKP